MLDVGVSKCKLRGYSTANLDHSASAVTAYMTPRPSCEALDHPGCFPQLVRNQLHLLSPAVFVAWTLRRVVGPCICWMASYAEAVWNAIIARLVMSPTGPPPNMRLKLTAPVVCGTIAFVNDLVRRRSLGAVR